MIKQLDKGLHGIAILLYDLRRREKDIVQNLEPKELNKKREYAEELTMIENAIIFLDKAGEESTKLIEYYERMNK